MFSRIIVCLFLCFTVTTIVAQKQVSKIIKSIRFEGLKKTKETHLNFFLESKVREQLSTEIVAADVQRLKNVVGVGNAAYRLDPEGEAVALIFEIKEVKTLLPIVNFGGIKGNVWFQVGFYDANWKGKGHFLSAVYQNFDKRHSGNIFYRIPRINQSNWGFSASIGTRASREPLFFDEGTVNYDYDIRSFGLTGIRNIGRNHSVEFGGTLFVEKYEKSGVQFLEITPGPDNLTEPKILSRLEYKADFLNYHLFYLSGLTWRTSLQNVFNFNDKYWFHIWQLQARYFQRIGGKGNLALRLKLGIATNNDTPFAPYVLDSHVNIRGVGNRIDRGTGQAILNVEYRQTLMESSLWGIQLVAFSDLGTWRNPGGTLDQLIDPDQFRHFVGGGFRIIYQKIYGAVLRVDYGIDIYDTKQRGLVIGFGQYF